MFLKKIRVVGFKSFANLVEIKLTEGITTIVGPNGSGKSNITDAVKWVLGEQSIKALRGKTRDDVIFSGTINKKPLGFAEVSLHFDNRTKYFAAEHEEIIVKRRLFRSGESEYYLNDNQCRLKDIQNIFMDTGLGKNGYSIISQGKMDTIINNDANELRQIIEEAVGVVKYKTRKNEAIRRLDKANNNIERAQDIFSEVDKQLGPLERKSKKAVRYLNLYEEKKETDLKVFALQIEKYNKQLYELKKNEKIVIEDICVLEKDINKKDELYQEIKLDNNALVEQLEEINNQNEKLREQFFEIQSDIRVIENKMQYNCEKINAVEENISKNDISLKEAEESKNIIIADNLNVKAVLTENEKKKIDLENHINENKRKISLIDQDESELIKNEEYEKNELNKLKTKYLDLDKDKYKLEIELQIITEKYDNQNEEIKRLKETKQKQTELLDKQIENCLTIEEKNVHIQKEMDKIHNEINKYKQTISRHENDKAVNEKKIEFLVELEKNFSGYFSSVKNLMQNLNQLSTEEKDKVHGPVGNILKIDQKYIIAIEMALGNQIQNIVVENVDTANSCISLLKRKEWGRATFLPLDNLKEFYAIDVKNDIEGYLGIAKDLITYNSKYERVMEYLLGKVILADNFENGKKIFKMNRKKFRVITLDGDVFNTGGSIVGGKSSNKKNQVLNNQIELKKLSRTNNQLEINIKKINENITSLNQKKHELEKKKNELITKNETELRNKWQLQNKCKELSDSISNLNEENNKNFKILEKNGLELSCLEDKICKVNTEIEAKTEKINENHNNKQYIQKNSLYEFNKRSEEEISELKILIAKNNEKQKYNNIKINELNNICKKTNEEIDFLSNEKERLQNDNIKIFSEKESLQKQQIKYKTDIETHDSQKKQVNDEYNKKSIKMDYLKEELKALNETFVALSQNKNDISIKINNLESEIKHLENDIYNEYETSYLLLDPILLEGTKKLVLKDIQNEQYELNRKLKSLGTINIDSIEEYKMVKERHSFLTNQITDLNTAKQELEKIIVETSNSMAEQFSINFNAIQNHFSHVFSELFEGGKAEIYLTDPDYPMESSIEINAEPPGKKLRHISLLSGGEKSMVAIALLFGILRTKPTPFCVVDEIDAALDDQNIVRYSHFLTAAAKKNQFIVITHRKRTMEIADVIYGISMGKGGISKVLSLQVSDYKIS